MNRRTTVAGPILLSVLSGCSGASPGDGETTVVTGPSQDGFGHVVERLDYSCGNLSCHGTPVRNLRIYGAEGRRLDPKDIPCGRFTTPAEVEYDYRSIVLLEPEVMAAVVADHGENAERLTIVRKARGTENHKGGTVFNDSTDMKACLAACNGNRACVAACYGDRCLVSWIAGKTDAGACDNSLPITRCDPTQ